MRSGRRKLRVFGTRTDYMGKQAMQTVTITVCIACFYVTVRTVRAATHLYFCLSVLVNHKATCLHSGRHF